MRATTRVSDPRQVLMDSRLDLWILHCDGTALPHGRDMGVGVHAVAPDGAVRTVSRRAVAQGRRGCSNEAEAHALFAAVELALAHGARRVRVHCDSDVVVAHACGRRRTTVKRIGDVIDRAMSLARQQGSLDVSPAFDVVLVTRARNGAADALARAALGLSRRPVTPSSPRGRAARAA